MAHIQWDEETIAEHDKLRGTRRKIIEANTPFIVYDQEDDTAVEKVMSSDEFVKNIKFNATVIDMSSINPALSKKNAEILKEKNINYLDAPVSGGTIGAEESTLAIMVGGEERIFKKCFNCFI